MFQVAAKVACPQCVAGEDEPCQSADGEPLADGAIHPARTDASAARLTELRRCGAKLYEWSEPPEYPGNLYIAGEECVIWMQPRPGWCDRGRWLATIDAWGRLGATLDGADGWPRYYMKTARAKDECLEWLRTREMSLVDAGNSRYDGRRSGQLRCIVCGNTADPFPMGDFEIIFCTRHTLEFIYRMGAATLQMLKDFTKGARTDG
jgi:hypothetical protein